MQEMLGRCHNFFSAFWSLIAGCLYSMWYLRTHKQSCWLPAKIPSVFLPSQDVSSIICLLPYPAILLWPAALFQLTITSCSQLVAPVLSSTSRSHLKNEPWLTHPQAGYSLQHPQQAWLATKSRFSGTRAPCVKQKQHRRKHPYLNPPSFKAAKFL